MKYVFLLIALITVHSTASAEFRVNQANPLVGLTLAEAKQKFARVCKYEQSEPDDYFGVISSQFSLDTVLDFEPSAKKELFGIHRAGELPAGLVRNSIGDYAVDEKLPELEFHDISCGEHGYHTFLTYKNIVFYIDKAGKVIEGNVDAVYKGMKPYIKGKIQSDTKVSRLDESICTMYGGEYAQLCDIDPKLRGDRVVSGRRIIAVNNEIMTVMVVYDGHRGKPNSSRVDVDYIYLPVWRQYQKDSESFIKSEASRKKREKEQSLKSSIKSFGEDGL